MVPEFFIIALTIIIGFLASVLFEKTRISQVIILMLFGFLLGPVLGLLDVSSESIIVSTLPFIATLALIVLLFDGGLELNIFALARSIPKSILYTFLVFLLSVFLITAFMVLLAGWPISYSLLLGAVVGGTSSAVVIAMVERTETKKETKSLLTVESTMTDALCIITAVIIAEIITANHVPEAGFVVSLLLSQFTIAIMLGVLASSVWMFIIDRLKMQEYTYMLMLSLVFGLYAVTEFVKGNGAIAVFVFGVIIGNARRIARFANFDWENPITRTTKLFQEEVTFFVRTFFFTYIGLLLSLDYFSVPIMAVTIGILALVIVSRFAVQRILLPRLPLRDEGIIISMMPRGLAVAVLATLPLTIGIEIPNFQEIAFTVLLLSNIIATVGIFIYDRGDIEAPGNAPVKSKEEEKKPKKDKKKKD